MGTRIEGGKLIFPDGTIQESAGTTVSNVTATRVVDTTYTNGARIRFVAVSLRLTPTVTGAAKAEAKIHATADPPTTVVGQAYQPSEATPNEEDVGLGFFIPPLWKYRIITTLAGGSNVQVSTWAEWDLF